MMTLAAQATAPENKTLDSLTIRKTLEDGLGGKFKNARVLVLIPDHTRTVPLPQLFPMMVEVLKDTAQLDFMVALGTHPPLPAEAIQKLLGISRTEREDKYRNIGLLNHLWNQDDALTSIGTLEVDQLKHIIGDYWHSSLGGDVEVVINRAIHDYDQIIILGPTFPHEVVGFSGGAKYLFPGISGQSMINFTHWLGALMTVLETIGIKDTPVRRVIHEAGTCIKTPIMLVSLVVVGDGLAGMYIGDHINAWSAAADLSGARQITWVDKPFKRVLSQAPKMYDELWTAAKAMYKLDPGIADGGELILYAPHLESVSIVHGNHIKKIGYHVRDYFLKQWEQFKDIPLGVLAHSTHLRGAGTFENGQEHPRIEVKLATKISKEDCEKLALGYVDPNEINPDEWKNREDEGILYVPKAGEVLYRVRDLGMLNQSGKQG